MQPNTMDCDTPEALRFFASACDRPVEGEWMRKAADEIERLRDERRWIPVSERLPERNKMVCVVCEGHATVGTYSPMMLDWWAMMPFTSNMVPTRLVTHWMPLPEPPEVK